MHMVVPVTQDYARQKSQGVKMNPGNKTSDL